MPLPVRTLLKTVRESRGLPAAELARRVGVSRQTIYAIEDGSFVPNTTVALRLARALEVRVEELFSLDETSETEPVPAEFLASEPGQGKEGQPVRLCRVNERLIAVPVSGAPTYLPPADGIVNGRSGGRASVKPANDLRQDRKGLLLAGCDPALSVLAEMLDHSGVQMISVPCSSRCALDWLKQGLIHAAGSHLMDKATGDYNVPLVKRLFPEGGVRIVTFATWEEGLVLTRGNPKKIRGIADIAGKEARLINREKGSGSRELLDNALRAAGISTKDIAGYQNVAIGHLSAAYAVASGTADLCIANRAAAWSFGLDFVPLAVERFDLTLSKTALELPAAKALLDLLNGAKLRRRLQTLAGYDTTHTGELRV